MDRSTFGGAIRVSWCNYIYGSSRGASNRDVLEYRFQ